MSELIALTGYARAGKDEAAKVLLEAGYKRRAFGDIIKRQVDPLVRQYLGFSAFTEVDAEKQQIRGVLEQWGESNYAGVMGEYFGSLPPRCVNTRLCRVAEAVEWRQRGGIIVQVVRLIDGQLQPAATEWEQAVLQSLRDRDLVDIVLVNDSSVEHLRVTMQSLFLANHANDPRAGGGPRTVRCSGALHAVDG